MDIIRVRVYAPTAHDPILGEDRLFVVRVTSDAGIDGWADGAACDDTLRSASVLGNGLFGYDPRALEDIGAFLCDAHKDAASMAIALEIACWDLASKAAGVPLALLLGGGSRTAVPLGRSDCPFNALGGEGPSRPLARLCELLVRAPSDESVTLDIGDFKGLGVLRQAHHLCAAWGRSVVLRQDVPGTLIAVGLAHLAASASGPLSLALHPGVPESDASEADLRVCGGSIHLPDGPGLGIQLDERALGEPILTLHP